MSTEDKNANRPVIGKMIDMFWLFQRHLADEMSVLDITVPQFFALHALDRLGGEANMGQLAQTTYQNPASMTGIIDRLLRSNLVERGRSDEDRRTVWVAITPDGRDLVRKAEARTTAHVENVFAALDESELAVIDRFIDGLISEVKS